MTCLIKRRENEEHERWSKKEKLSKAGLWYCFTLCLNFTPVAFDVYFCPQHFASRVGGGAHLLMKSPFMCYYLVFS